MVRVSKRVKMQKKKKKKKNEPSRRAPVILDVVGLKTAWGFFEKWTRS